ncbi:acetylornithine deacetylase [Tamaricihabitans halophyticus]|uniref:Probable succinyl-diaminopimelate desuccinylase n=1 Tax=Tamaricihabitans halophyticus TaxID=1262583 RepID=A0A4V2STA8_9PSEU|nr:ArgE/DapE family deacylase [Tamaricihabitans halophyticus]TCP50056.1 acetylornithine deacetylase [Tamaricihabitans halophyticus]
MGIDWRARVLREIDATADELLSSLSALVRVPSVGGSAAEHEAQQQLADTFGTIGLDTDHWRIPLAETLAAPDFPGVEVDRDEAWGLVGRLPGTGGGPTLLLNGHIDVVPPGDRASWVRGEPFSGQLDGETVHGRGSCDMKAGLLAAVWAVRALRRCAVPLRGDLLLASVQGEEDGGLGSYAMLARGWRADACVIPEPTSLDLVPANGGALTFRLRVRGHATHASRRTSGVSAIEKFWPVWRALGELERARNAAVDPLMSRWDIAYPLAIGTVQAGDWASSVPDLLVAEGRLGVALDEPVAQARAQLENAIAAVNAEDPWLREHPVTVEWWGGQFAAGKLAEHSDLPDRVSAAHAAVTGGAPQQTWGAPYGSDLRLLTGIGGIPTLHYGPGDAGVAHGPDEFVPVAEVLTTARALAVLALDYCTTQ